MRSKHDMGGATMQDRSLLSSVKWWPTLAGAAFAAFVALDLFSGGETGADLGPIVAASGLVYLAAAALRRPWTAWPAFLVSVVVITAAKLGWIGLDATWILLGLAALLALFGLLSGAARPVGGLPLQTVAMLGFGAVAALAIYVAPTVGAYAVAGGLLAHAAWDVYHHRANRVVGRSMAEFCFVLDVLLAAAIIWVTVRI